MQVLFPAALDAIAPDLEGCPSRRWQGAMRAALQSAPRRGGKTADAQVAWPMRAAEEAMIAALSDRLAIDADGVEAPWSDFPVFAWQTPTAIELGFSTLSPVVRRHLVDGDEPGALASSRGGWRAPLSVFRFADGLATVRVTSRARITWAEWLAVRESLLDSLADRRQPLLGRLAEIAVVCATIANERAIPGALPTLTARDFLAWRGFLESRCAAAEADQLAALLRRVEPLFAGPHGLGSAQAAAVSAALSADWRAAMTQWVVPVEKEIAPAIEGLMGLWLLGAPIVRDLTLTRAWAEIGEALALGLRFAAAIGEAQRAPVSLEQAAAALALGEHAVAWSNLALPSFELPGASHDRGPRMVDLDMTLESIC